jgi:hypothetical protein
VSLNWLAAKCFGFCCDRCHRRIPRGLRPHLCCLVIRTVRLTDVLYRLVCLRQSSLFRKFYISKSDIYILLSHWSAALSPSICPSLGLLQPQPTKVIRQDVAIGVAHAHCVALRAVLCDYC